MSDITAALEAVRAPLGDLAIRVLDVEKCLWVDADFAQVAKDIISLTESTEARVESLWQHAGAWGLSTLRGEALLVDLRRTTTALLQMCGTVRSATGNAVPGALEMLKDSLRYHRMALSDLLSECRALRERAIALEKAGHKPVSLPDPKLAASRKSISVDAPPAVASATNANARVSSSVVSPPPAAPAPPIPPRVDPTTLLRLAEDLAVELNRYVEFVRLTGGSATEDARAPFMDRVKRVLEVLKNLNLQGQKVAPIAEPLGIVLENTTAAVRSGESFLFKGQGGLARLLQAGESAQTALQQIQQYCTVKAESRRSTTIVSRTSAADSRLESPRTPKTTTSLTTASAAAANDDTQRVEDEDQEEEDSSHSPDVGEPGSATKVSAERFFPSGIRAKVHPVAVEMDVELKRFILFVREMGDKATQEDMGAFMDRVKTLLALLRQLDSATADAPAEDTMVEHLNNVKQNVQVIARAAKSYLFEGQGGLARVVEGGNAVEDALRKIREWCGESKARVSPPSEIPEQVRPHTAVISPGPASSPPPPPPWTAVDSTSVDSTVAPSTSKHMGVTDRIRAEPPPPSRLVPQGAQDDELLALEGMLEEKDLYAKNRWQKPYAREQEYRRKQDQTMAKGNALKGRSDLQGIVPRRTSSAAELGAKAVQLREREEKLKREQEELELLETEHELSLKEKELAEKEFRIAQQKRLLEQKMTTTGAPTAGGFVIVNKKPF